MFRSKTRDIIIPQSEHAQFAGMMALNWGNENFDIPPFDFDSFTAGVALHDLGHGFFDVNEIGAMEDKQAYQADAALVACRLPDALADAVAHFHILRLLSNHSTYTDLIERCEQIIEEDIKRTGIARDIFLWADRITQLCDYTSFDFCFEKQTERHFDIAPAVGSNETIRIKMHYDGGTIISLNPWPLKPGHLTGFIMGYVADGYPHDLKPVVKRYQIIPG